MLNLSILTIFPHIIPRNYAAEALYAAEKGPLHYWAREGEAKVDFVVEHDGKIFPLEVKSGSSTKKKSLLVYQQKYHPPVLSQANLLNLKRDGDVCNYPLYLLSRFPFLSN